MLNQTSVVQGALDNPIREEYIDDDDVIAFCINRMNKMRWNLFKISSCAINHLNRLFI